MVINPQQYFLAFTIYEIPVFMGKSKIRYVLQYLLVIVQLYIAYYIHILVVYIIKIEINVLIK